MRSSTPLDELVAGPEIGPGGERPERESYRDVVLAERLRSALHRLNRHLPAEALEDGLRKVLRPESSGLVENKRRLISSGCARRLLYSPRRLRYLG
jgi:type I site-specific restriction-modification system R (restriction) subunit